MYFEIRHTTRYTYSGPVSLEPTLVRLRPRSDCTQRLLDFSLTVGPPPAGRCEGIGLEGNTAITLWFTGHVNRLTLESRALVETLRTNPFDFLVADPGLLSLPVQYPDPVAQSLAPHLRRTGERHASESLASRVASEAGGDTVRFLVALTEHIATSLGKERRPEGMPLSPAQTLARGKGACRDLAVLFMDCCRSQGLAARFVSGYEEIGVDEPRSELHAWAEVFLTGAGWRGFDPNEGLAVADRHVALAAASDPAGATPIEGTFRGDGVTSALETDLTVTRVDGPGDRDERNRAGGLERRES